MFKPVYRELIRSSLTDAWKDRWLWPLAVFAALLHTGGIYDVIIHSMHMVQVEGAALIRGGISPDVLYGWANLTLQNGWFPFLGTLQSVIFSILFVLTLLALSVIAQGALTFGIGGRVRGKKPSFRECLTAGAHAFGKLAMLNIITIGAIWLSRLLLLLPYGYAQTGTSSVFILIYFLTALVFIALIIAFTSIHFFALNAILLQDAHLMEALKRSILLLQKGWVAVLELAFLLFGIGVALFMLAAVVFAIMFIPIFFLMIGALLTSFQAGIFFGYSVIVFLAIVIALIAGAFTVTFQFAAWHRLFIKLGEGGPVAKLHRWSHWFLGAPQPKKK